MPRRDHRRSGSRRAFLVWIVSAVPVLWLTWPAELRPRPDWDRIAWVPWSDPHGGVVEILANVLLFVPFGWAGVRACGARTGVVVAPLAALVLSAGVEVLQAFGPGRYSTTRDVLANLAGALIGALVAYRGLRR